MGHEDLQIHVIAKLFCQLQISALKARFKNLTSEYNEIIRRITLPGTLVKLESLTIKNLRCLVQEQSFRMRPLTFVVGANSSGKSTFIRTFPLMRQSAETSTRGPILWFGRLVDFGVFKDVVSKQGGPEIEFGFRIKMPEGSTARYQFNAAIFLEEIEIQVNLILAEDQGSTYAKGIKIEIIGRKIELGATPDGRIKSLKIDGVQVAGDISTLKLKGGASLIGVEEISKENKSGSRRMAGPFTGLLRYQVNRLFHGSTHQVKIDQFIRGLGIGRAELFVQQMKNLATVTPTSRERSRHYAGKPNWVQELQGLVIANKSVHILNRLDYFLVEIFKKVSYMGPLRATAERFYRHQDLSVEEVDPQGGNLAMFLMGLSSQNRTHFSAWCQSNIGFSIDAVTAGSHASINLTDSANGNIFNIADMGFGYSQLLPLLATMWHSTERGTQDGYVDDDYEEEDEPVPKIVVIEQPELHLHPRLQGRLSQLLCRIAVANRGAKVPVSLICETHSDTIINYVGKLIAEGVIDHDEIDVLVFEKDEDTGETIASRAEYDKEGVLQNWPYGFFLPTD